MAMIPPIDIVVHAKFSMWTALKLRVAGLRDALSIESPDIPFKTPDVVDLHNDAELEDYLHDLISNMNTESRAALLEYITVTHA